MEYLKTFWSRRYLLAELVKKGIKLKYRRSYLGILWSLLEPLMTTAVLTVVFGTLFDNKNKLFPLYILSGRLLYSFFSSGTKACSKAIRANAGMIKKVYVPKYLYPMSSVLFNFIIFMISLLVMIPLFVYPVVDSAAYDIRCWNDPSNCYGIFPGYGISVGCISNDHYVYMCDFLLSDAFVKKWIFLAVKV